VLPAAGAFSFNAGEPIVSSRMIQLINAPATIYVKAVIAAKAGIQTSYPELLRSYKKYVIVNKI